ENADCCSHLPALPALLPRACSHRLARARSKLSARAVAGAKPPSFPATAAGLRMYGPRFLSRSEGRRPSDNVSESERLSTPVALAQARHPIRKRAFLRARL